MQQAKKLLSRNNRFKVLYSKSANENTIKII